MSKGELLKDVANALYCCRPLQTKIDVKVCEEVLIPWSGRFLAMPEFSGKPFYLEVLAFVVHERFLLEEKVNSLMKQNRALEEECASLKAEDSEGIEEESGDEAANGIEALNKEERPLGVDRFTRVHFAAQRVFPEQFEEVKAMNKAQRARTKEIAKLKAKIKDLNSTMEETNCKKKNESLQNKITWSVGQIKKKETEQQLKFKQGCDLAKALNKRVLEKAEQQDKQRKKEDVHIRKIQYLSKQLCEEVQLQKRTRLESGDQKTLTYEECIGQLD